MEDKHLLLSKKLGVLRGIVLEGGVARDILSRDSVRLFGKDYGERDVFCEWFAVTSKDDGSFVGVCLTDFYRCESDSVIRRLEAENTESNDNGWVVLLTEVPNWEVQLWPYLPVHFLQTKSGECCYLIPSAFRSGDQLPSALRHVASLDEIAGPEDLCSR